MGGAGGSEGQEIGVSTTGGRVEECPVKQGLVLGDAVRRAAPRRAASQRVDMAVGDVFINNGISKCTLNLDTRSTNQTGGSPMGSGSALHRAVIYEYSLCRRRLPLLSYTCSGNITQRQRRKMPLWPN